jgi:hypothetical protein
VVPEPEEPLGLDPASVDRPDPLPELSLRGAVVREPLSELLRAEPLVVESRPLAEPAEPELPVRRGVSAPDRPELSEPESCAPFCRVDDAVAPRCRSCS